MFIIEFNSEMKHFMCVINCISENIFHWEINSEMIYTMLHDVIIIRLKKLFYLKKTND
jgi:hypothetical protein